MNKFIGYIIRLTVILLSVIFLTITGVDDAIAANNVDLEKTKTNKIEIGDVSEENTDVEVMKCPSLSCDPCYYRDIDTNKFWQEVNRFRKNQQTLKKFVYKLYNFEPKKRSTSNIETKQSTSNTETERSTSNTETEQSPSIQ